MKKIVSICFISMLFGCNSAAIRDNNNTAEVNKSTSVEDKKTSPVSDKDNDSESAELMHVATRFYKEVCGSDIESPYVVLNESGYYELDMASHKTALQKTGIFTNHFIAAQDSIFAECKLALETEKIKEYDVESIDMNGPSSCGFLDYAYYFQSQESPDSFSLKRSAITGNTATTEIHFYNGERSWDDQIYLVIELKKQNESWYINKVEKKL